MKALNQQSTNQASNASHFGFGLDYQYRERYSFSGMQGLINKFRSLLSHVSIVSIPNLEEVNYVKQILGTEMPFIHHLSGIAPADPHGPHLNVLQLQDKISQALDAVWCLEDIGIWSVGPYSLPYFVPVLFDPQIADLVAERIKNIQENVNIPFLAEIPACSFVMGKQTLGDFFHQLVNKADCGIVLDVSHVFSYALATDTDPVETLHSLPCNKVIEIHIAGGRLNRNHNYRYIDSHSAPIMSEVYGLLEKAVACCTNLRAITYEIGVQSTEDLIYNEVQRLQETLLRLAFQPKFH